MTGELGSCSMHRLVYETFFVRRSNHKVKISPTKLNTYLVCLDCGSFNSFDFACCTMLHFQYKKHLTIN